MKRQWTLVLKHRGKFLQDTMEGTVGGAERNCMAKSKGLRQGRVSAGLEGWTKSGHTEAPPYRSGGRFSTGKLTASACAFATHLAQRSGWGKPRGAGCLWTWGFSSTGEKGAV